MRTTDDDLRRGLLDPAPSSREACPGSDTLASAAAGRLEEPARDTVLDHLAVCRACAEEVIALRPLGPWARAAAARFPEAGRGTRARPRPWTRWSLWATAAVAVVGLSLLLPRGSGPPQERTQPEPAIRSLIPESTPLPRDRCVLRWSDAGPGARYAVSVLSNDLQPLATATGLERPEYTVPADALRTVPAGGGIVWSVEARWPDGRRRSSPTFVVRLD